MNSENNLQVRQLEIPLHQLGQQYLKGSTSLNFTKMERLFGIPKRFINDGFRIWLPPADFSEEEVEAKWVEFQADVNDDNGLEWEFEETLNSVVFLDLRLTMNKDGLMKTTLYQKPIALHLFIPTNSMHPPVVLYSHMCGNILQYFASILMEKIEWQTLYN